MIALDTNVIVRFLVEDDPDQAERARRLIADALAAGEECFVSDIVCCEVAWVLLRRYRVEKGEFIARMRQLVDSRPLVFASPDRLHAALLAFERGRGDFADYLIFERGRAAGCRQMATFDRALLEEPGFVEP